MQVKIRRIYRYMSVHAQNRLSLTARQSRGKQGNDIGRLAGREHRIGPSHPQMVRKRVNAAHKARSIDLDNADGLRRIVAPLAVTGKDDEVYGFEKAVRLQTGAHVQHGTGDPSALKRL
jgi:hypothetical protein